MSGYPEDPSQSPRPPDPHEIELARASVNAPAVLLIVIGLLALIGAIWGLVQLPQVPAKVDELVAEIGADPNMPNDQKDMAKRVLSLVKEAAENNTASVAYIISIVGSLVVILGGVVLMRLSGKVLPIAGSVLAMIPCTVGCCCLLGLPVGIWALIALYRPHVQAVIAYKRAGPPPDPDAQYMR